jgi:amidophosphoribosyltransferase
VVIIDALGMRFAQAVPAQREARCLFEFIYFARPDSRMYGTSLYRARERMGERLAVEQPAEAEIVVPVPDSGIPAALGFSRVSGIRYHEAMIKNRYIHRTFIQPDQRMRELGVQMKLAPMIEEIEGKTLVLVDDSIVRATTTLQIVKLLRDCGARAIHVRITAPPIRHPCFYGIDMSSRGELAAASMSVDEIAQHLRADSLGYLSIEGACEAVGQPLDAFCLACFNGDYPVPVPDGLSKDALTPGVGQLSTVASRLG